MSRGFGIPATPDSGRAGAVAAQCEKLGYSTVWSNDIPGADGLLTVRHMAEATQQVRVGVGVVACDRRAPSEVAELIRSIDLPLDRFVLGLGAGGSSRPIKTVREAVGTIRKEFGNEVTIGIAALGPRMCRLAGEIADLVLFNWMVPERIVWASERVREGEAGARRVERAAYIRVGLAPEGGALIAAEAAKYNRYPGYDRHFAAMGAPLESVGVWGAPEELPSGLAAYDSVLDEAVVRALPAQDTIESTLAVAIAAAPNALDIGLA